MIGPTAWFDLLRLTRRPRSFGVRAGYALFLLFVVFLFFWRFDAEHIAPSQVSSLAERFTNEFFLWQAVALVVLVPAYFGGALAEEKERGTLDLLFTTHLTVRELVLGKLVGRLVHLLGLVLAGVPVLALVLLLGGVNPALVAGQTLAAVAGIWSIGCFSLYQSARSHTVSAGIFRAYGGIAGLHLLAGLLGILLCCIFPVILALSTPIGFAAFAMTVEEPRTLLGLALAFALVHGSLGIIFLHRAIHGFRGWQYPHGVKAVLVLRSARPSLAEVPLASPADRTASMLSVPPEQVRSSDVVIKKIIDLEEPTQPPMAPGSAERYLYPPPAVTDEPVVWKEVWFGRGTHQQRMLEALLRAISYLALILLAVGWAMNPLFLAGSIYLAAFLLCVELAGSLAREKTQRTWDSLLLLPQSRGTLFMHKAKGCILRRRSEFLWIAGLSLLVLFAIPLSNFLWLWLLLLSHGLVLLALAMLLGDRIVGTTESRGVFAALFLALLLICLASARLNSGILELCWNPVAVFALLLVPVCWYDYTCFDYALLVAPQVLLSLLCAGLLWHFALRPYRPPLQPAPGKSTPASD